MLPFRLGYPNLKTHRLYAPIGYTIPFSSSPPPIPSLSWSQYLELNAHPAIASRGISIVNLVFSRFYNVRLQIATFFAANSMLTQPILGTFCTQFSRSNSDEGLAMRTSICRYFIMTQLQLSHRLIVCRAAWDTKPPKVTSWPKSALSSSTFSA